ncbi:hypothetical protein [Halorussus halophilus]|uniref:hypothetical protein n=1 Tax=Halorussus halophilus TaxID=2650975 RepID=UPI001301853B|nr:hypothetical protein [Halorussus halophilus]
MRLRTDERGVTVQIGTVLLFAVLVVLLSTYQAQVVPQENSQVEFKHNQQVQNQLQDLRDELHRTAATDSGGSASIPLGTQYPVRALFVNPPSPSGTLRTTELGTDSKVSIENAVASGETRDYWDGSTQEFSTRGLSYEPNYHVYQNAPTTVYANGVLYNRFDSAKTVVAGQRLVKGNTLSLVTVDGTLSKSSSQSLSVSPTAVSASTRTIAVRESGDPIELTVPTELSATMWEETLLEDEFDGSDSDEDAYVQAVESVPGEDAVRIVLEPGTYELQLAKVGVGNDVSGVEPHYVTDVSGDNTSVAENSTRKLVVEVRDRYNNPVTGARVNLSLVSNDLPDRLHYRGEVGETLTDVRTDGQGQVELRYEVDEFDGANRRVKVRTSIADVPPTSGEFEDGAQENLTFRLSVYGVGGPGNGNGPGGPTPTPGGIEYNRDAVAVDADNEGTPASVRFSVTNSYDQQLTITDVEIDPKRGKIKQLSDPSSNEGQWESELYVDADTRDGINDVPGGADLPTSLDMSEFYWQTTPSVEPVLSGGSTATFSLMQFLEGNGNNPQQADMTGETVSVRITYRLANGTVETEELTIEATGA